MKERDHEIASKSSRKSARAIKSCSLTGNEADALPPLFGGLPAAAVAFPLPPAPTPPLSSFDDVDDDDLLDGFRRNLETRESR